MMIYKTIIVLVWFEISDYDVLLNNKYEIDRHEESELKSWGKETLL